MPPLFFLRRLRGWSQQELADRAGLTRETISHLESGRQSPRRGTALLLAAALNCTPEALFPALNDESPAGTPGSVTASARQGRDVQE